eukprot:3042546-Pyramimonas_sp.AAC.1
MTSFYEDVSSLRGEPLSEDKRLKIFNRARTPFLGLQCRESAQSWRPDDPESLQNADVSTANHRDCRALIILGRAKTQYLDGQQ